jgi:hypothetical protein
VHGWILIEGYWPAPVLDISPEASSNKIMALAPYTRCVEVIADINFRLKKAGSDGIKLRKAILEWALQNRKTDIELKLDLGYDENEAFYYITGWFTKLTPYRVWKAMRTYRIRLKRRFYGISRSSLHSAANHTHNKRYLA